MLEFYEAYADYNIMMARVEQLVVSAAEAVRTALVGQSAADREGLDVPSLTPPFARVEWVPSLKPHWGRTCSRWMIRH